MVTLYQENLLCMTFNKVPYDCCLHSNVCMQRVYILCYIPFPSLVTFPSDPVHSLSWTVCALPSDLLLALTIGVGVGVADVDVGVADVDVVVVVEGDEVEGMC